MLLNTKNTESISLLNRKGQVMTIDAATHKKQYELLPQEKKARLMETRAEQHHEHMTKEDKKNLHK
jgi:hypothetical protein